MFFLSGCTDGKTHKMENRNLVEQRIGRFKLDLPADFSLLGRSPVIIVPRDENSLGTKMEIESFSAKMTKQEFESAVAERAKELEEAGDEFEDKLELVTKQPDGSVIFRVRRIKDAYFSELDSLVDGIYMRTTARSYHGTYEQVEKSLLHFARTIVPLSAGSPSDFCIGYICVPGTSSFEAAQFIYRSSQRRDIRIEISVDTYQPDSDKPLLVRISGEDSLLKVFDLQHRVLRKGELTVAGMHAQEWLGSANMEDDRNSVEYKFVMETLRTDPGPSKPSMHVELMTGRSRGNENISHNSLTKDGALQMWDTIIGSIELKK